MGWNTWNTFTSNINEAKLREIADVMVSSGMEGAGYKYLIIDDCWQGGRDSLGFIYPDPAKFPSGLKALADYIHSRGLKFGIYSDPGDSTCAHYIGSRGHEYQDALIYAKWGVDYLKYDWCSTDSLNAYGAYTTMHDALFAAKRPVVFSLCEWGNHNPWLWGGSIGHLWRVSGDITPCFDCIANHGTYSDFGILKILDMRPDIRVYSGPDHWNDFDMMEVGNRMTVSEDRAHFSLWCMTAAPLFAGNDIRNMTGDTKNILTNIDAIAIDQDPLGIQGFRSSAQDSIEVWVKPLMKGDWAVCFLNRSLQTKKMEYDWSKNIITDDFAKRVLNANLHPYKIRNVWTKKDSGTTKKIFSGTIPPHDVILVRLSILD